MHNNWRTDIRVIYPPQFQTHGPYKVLGTTQLFYWPVR